MKKYIITYNSIQYIENPYDNNKTTIFQQILPLISDEEAKELSKSSIISIFTKNESKHATNVGTSYQINLNFSEREKFEFVFKYVFDPIWIKMFQIKEAKITEDEIKIWFPSEDMDANILNLFPEFLNSNKDNNDEDVYLKQTEELEKVYPIERIKLFTYEEFRIFVGYLNKCKHPSTKRQFPDQWGYFINENGEVKSCKKIVEQPDFEEFKKELIEILENYEQYQYFNEFELKNKFKYINSTVISLYQRSYIFMTRPDLKLIFVVKSNLHILFDYLYGEKGVKNKVVNLDLNSGIISIIINEWLTSLKIEQKQQHNFTWWLIENVVIKKNKAKQNVDYQEKFEEDSTNNTSISYEKIFLEDDKIEQFLKKLNYRKNLIVKGQPGTGKSFSVKEILSLNGFDVKSIIQFSQNTSYNDFIEGYVPKNGEVGFELRYGILRELSAKAQKNKNQKYALIIDEINRGNISNIFGEAFTLIESSKRDEEYQMKLPLSKESFYVPSNVYIVGTMNTVDKSLYNLDYALQRRFEWMNFEPSFNSKLVGYACKRNQLDEQIVKKAVNKLIDINDNIVELTDEDDYKIGHAFFVEVIENSKNDIEFIENFNEMLNTDYLNLFQQYELNFDTFEKVKWEGILDNAKIHSPIQN